MPMTPVGRSRKPTNSNSVTDVNYRTEDERTIANKLAREEKREKEAEKDDEETAASKKDSTLPVRFFQFNRERPSHTDTV